MALAAIAGMLHVRNMDRALAHPITPAIYYTLKFGFNRTQII